ncbi:hypothetical protein KFE94_15330 [bacterium SCSIO 12643]|nr:hypothetical protein KFE94_15330 [bacterium SCSIO 12643]
MKKTIKEYSKLSKFDRMELDGLILNGDTRMITVPFKGDLVRAYRCRLSGTEVLVVMDDDFEDFTQDEDWGYDEEYGTY